MNPYEQEIDMYFELKGTPDSSRESYFRRINAFIQSYEGFSFFLQRLFYAVTEVGGHKQGKLKDKPQSLQPLSFLHKDRALKVLKED